MLKQNFKEKETKLINDFSRLKMLKNKLENKLYAQDYSKKTTRMMLRHKRLCDEHSEKAIDKPIPFHLRREKMAQSALYDGNEILKPGHLPANVPSLEESSEIGEYPNTI